MCSHCPYSHHTVTTSWTPRFSPVDAGKWSPSPSNGLFPKAFYPSYLHADPHGRKAKRQQQKPNASNNNKVFHTLFAFLTFLPFPPFLPFLPSYPLFPWTKKQKTSNKNKTPVHNSPKAQWSQSPAVGSQSHAMGSQNPAMGSQRRECGFVFAPQKKNRFC